MVKRIFLRLLVNPIFLVIYGIVWYHLAKLCQYGNIRAHLLPLACCTVFFLLYFVEFIVLIFLYEKRSSTYKVNEFRVEETGLQFRQSETQWQKVSYQNIRQSDITKKRIFLYLPKHTLYQLELKGIAEEEKILLIKKLHARGTFRTLIWKKPVLILLIIVTVIGGLHVGKSATGLNGSLAWAIEKVKNQRTVELDEAHINIYRTGIEGILEDVRTKVELPEKLTLASSFNLHFLPDGTIDTLDTFLCGYDKHGKFVNSYLISYDRKKSDQITIYLNGTVTEHTYEKEKDLQPLVEAVSLVNLERQTAAWKQDVYGILYYGMREWYAGEEGLIRLKPDGTLQQLGAVDIPGGLIETYSISLFCPENESIAPIRFLYNGTR
ncbi:MAG: hypothetical protein PHP50_04370 [Lachnospiraceae bacterium]|nr:hypothetical protein [Lachnospiraceae bacterium]